MGWGKSSLSQAKTLSSEFRYLHWKLKWGHSFYCQYHLIRTRSFLCWQVQNSSQSQEQNGQESFWSLLGISHSKFAGTSYHLEIFLFRRISDLCLKNYHWKPVHFALSTAFHRNSCSSWWYKGEQEKAQKVYLDFAAKLVAYLWSFNLSYFGASQ